MMGRIGILLGFLWLGLPAWAQQPQSICTDEPFRQFDFWLGQWSVARANAPDTELGTNSIRAIDAGCGLLEQWTSAGGSTGTSLNVYNPITRTWRQIWVSDQGYSIDIEGGWSDGAMRMQGEIFYGDGRRRPIRGSWTPDDDGTVRQTFHEQHDGQWRLWFDGIYTER